MARSYPSPPNKGLPGHVHRLRRIPAPRPHLAGPPDSSRGRHARAHHSWQHAAQQRHQPGTGGALDIGRAAWGRSPGLQAWCAQHRRDASGCST